MKRKNANGIEQSTDSQHHCGGFDISATAPKTVLTDYMYRV